MSDSHCKCCVSLYTAIVLSPCSKRTSSAPTMTQDTMMGNVTALNMRMNNSPHIRIQSMVLLSKFARRNVNPSVIPKTTATRVASSDLLMCQSLQRPLTATQSGILTSLLVSPQEASILPVLYSQP